mmetsp:Transcript_3911/g.13859  ORF Transcript_3911/g.13859 Transcript_3911/m.13859 type:complete len:1002 (-) Transcript_3911:1248-4253(-)
MPISSAAVSGIADRKDWYLEGSANLADMSVGLPYICVANSRGQTPMIRLLQLIPPQGPTQRLKRCFWPLCGQLHQRPSKFLGGHDHGTDFYPEFPVVDAGRGGIKTYRIQSKDLAHAFDIPTDFCPSSIVHSQTHDLVCCFGSTGSGGELCYLVRTSLRLGTFSPETITSAMHGAFLGEEENTLGLLMDSDAPNQTKLRLYRLGQTGQTSLEQAYAELDLYLPVVAVFNAAAAFPGAGKSQMRALYYVKDRSSTVSYLHYSASIVADGGEGEDHEGLHPLDEPLFEFESWEGLRELAVQHIDAGAAAASLVALLTSRRICLLSARVDGLQLLRTYSMAPPPQGVKPGIASILWAGPVLLFSTETFCNYLTVEGNTGTLCSIPFSLWGPSLATVLHDRLVYAWADVEGAVHIQVRPVGLMEPMLRGWLDCEQMLRHIHPDVASQVSDGMATQLEQTLETFDVQRIDTALIDALSLSMQTSSARRLASATHLGEQKRLATALVAKQFDAVYSSLYRKWRSSPLFPSIPTRIDKHLMHVREEAMQAGHFDIVLSILDITGRYWEIFSLLVVTDNMDGARALCGASFRARASDPQLRDVAYACAIWLLAKGETSLSSDYDGVSLQTVLQEVSVRRGGVVASRHVEAEASFRDKEGLLLPGLSLQRWRIGRASANREVDAEVMELKEQTETIFNIRARFPNEQVQIGRFGSVVEKGRLTAMLVDSASQLLGCCEQDMHVLPPESGLAVTDQEGISSANIGGDAGLGDTDVVPGVGESVNLINMQSLATSVSRTEDAQSDEEDGTGGQLSSMMMSNIGSKSRRKKVMIKIRDKSDVSTSSSQTVTPIQPLSISLGKLSPQVSSSDNALGAAPELAIPGGLGKSESSLEFSLGGHLGPQAGGGTSVGVGNAMGVSGDQPSATFDFSMPSVAMKPNPASGLAQPPAQPAVAPSSALPMPSGGPTSGQTAATLPSLGASGLSAGKKFSFRKKIQVSHGGILEGPSHAAGS